MAEAEHAHIANHLAQLRAGVQSLEPLRHVALTLPRTGTVYQILQPADLDALLDVAAHDPEQNLPYWAEIWPSGIALAEAIIQHPDALRGHPTIEVGSGLGITAIAALTAGAELTVTDYSAESLVLCRYNTYRNAGREPQTALQSNWRQPPAELFRVMPEGFPRVLAADVLYEGRDVAPLLTLLDRLVAPGGLLWLAEPGRPVAQRFLRLATTRGWRSATNYHDGPWPDPRDADVRVRIHQMRKPPRLTQLPQSQTQP